jgi:peptide/nickel transport system substrate-binding protein
MVLLMLLLASACQPSPQVAAPEVEETATEEIVQPAEETEPVVEEVAPTEEEEREPRTFVYGDIADIGACDPRNRVGGSCGTMIANVYETLVYYKIGTYVVDQPSLATSWEQSEDGLEWTFHLREGVTFHNGDPFTADDVKKTFDRVLAVGGGKPLNMLGSALDSTEVVDDYTVRFHLKYPYSYFFSNLAKVTIVNAETIEANEVDGDWANEWFAAGNHNGTGPYSLAERNPGEGYTLMKNENWWGKFPENAYDRIVVRVIPEGGQQRLLLETGELDMVSDWISVVDKLDAGESENVKLNMPSSFGMALLTIHAGREPLDNKLVRQAMLYAYPYEQLLSYYRGHGRPGSSALSADYPGHDPNLPVLAQDLDKARELLAEAGYPNGGFTLFADYFEGDEEKRQQELVFQGALAELGIDLEITPVPVAALFEKGLNPETSSHFNAHFEAVEHDPFAWIQKMFASEGGYNNMVHMTVPRIDEIVFEGQREFESERRVELLQEAERIIMEEVLVIPAVQPAIVNAMSTCVQGFVFDPMEYQGVPKFWLMYEDPGCQ